MLFAIKTPGDYFVRSDGKLDDDVTFARKFSCPADLHSVARTIGLEHYEPFKVDEKALAATQDRLAREMEERRAMGQFKSMLGDIVNRVSAIANGADK